MRFASTFVHKSLCFHEFQEEWYMRGCLQELSVRTAAFPVNLRWRSLSLLTSGSVQMGRSPRSVIRSIFRTKVGERCCVVIGAVLEPEKGRHLDLDLRQQ